MMPDATTEGLVMKPTVYLALVLPVCTQNFIGQDS
jgi:hypothetical protein